jgi:hypothetical protein
MKGAILTDLSSFTETERTLILDAPGAVLKGAIVADGQKNALAFLKEVTTGAKAFREAQSHENAFVKAVANAQRDRPEPADDDREFSFSDEAMTKALKEAQEAMALLREKADQGDAEAYASWLTRIATKVAETNKTKEGGFFSKKVAISEGEKVFLEHLDHALNA